MSAAALAVAIGVWWNANTVAHLFIHRPFFRSRRANAWFAALLTALLGFPQSLWRDRHLAHHRSAAYRFRVTREIAIQGGIVAALWTALAVTAPAFFTSAYLPGYLGGLALCALHGYYEHAGGTTSHYGQLYNLLCFNDGYHVEHHRHPSAAWWTLPACREPAGRASGWPAPLRWIDAATPAALGALERLVLRSRVLQRYVVRVHARAFRALLGDQPRPRDITIVGGGLFPRTALVLRQLFPDARITIVDRDRAHLDAARRFLQGESVSYVVGHVTTEQQSRLRSHEGGASPGEARGGASGAEAAAICTPTCDLAIFPLALNGNRAGVYARPPAARTIVHDWIWHASGRSRIVSPLLLKRLNLVTR
jgi:hypothetical protein